MNPRILMLVAVVVAVLGAGAWLVGNTVWEDRELPMPLRGAAARNPLFAAQRFAEALGARTDRPATFTPPPPGALLVLANWRWNLSARRRDAVVRWVEAGGRLVVDRDVLADESFGRWAGLGHRVAASATARDEARPAIERLGLRQCRDAQGTRIDPDRVVRTAYSLCGGDASSIVPSNTPEWELHDALGAQAVRVAVGRGTVTAFNGRPYQYRRLLDGDHAAIFVAATDVRRGDAVVFLTEAAHPSLPTLIWEEGAASVVLALLAVGLWLWRGAIRFGPPAPVATGSRRSVAEQILGTGRFVLRRGEGHALYEATVRAMEEAARRRVGGDARRRMGGDARRPNDARATTLAGIAQVDAGALDAALHDPAARRPERLRTTIALVETVRRRLAQPPHRSPHGTR